MCSIYLVNFVFNDNARNVERHVNLHNVYIVTDMPDHLDINCIMTLDSFSFSEFCFLMININARNIERQDMVQKGPVIMY